MISASAFILIGGNSKRFGTTKWQAMINGKTVLERMWKSCDKFQERYLIGKYEYSDQKKPILKDKLEIEAPINGLYTALDHSNTDWILLLSCDLPLIDEKILGHLWSFVKPDRNIIIPEVNKGLQPTCAFYKKSLKDIVMEQINNDSLGLIDLVRKIEYHPIDLTERSDYFLNMNTKNDMRAAEKILSSKVIGKSLL